MHQTVKGQHTNFLKDSPKILWISHSIKTPNSRVSCHIVWLRNLLNFEYPEIRRALVVWVVSWEEQKAEHDISLSTLINRKRRQTRLHLRELNWNCFSTIHYRPHPKDGERSICFSLFVCPHPGGGGMHRPGTGMGGGGIPSTTLVMSNVTLARNGVLPLQSRSIDMGHPKSRYGVLFLFKKRIFWTAERVLWYTEWRYASVAFTSGGLSCPGFKSSGCFLSYVILDSPLLWHMLTVEKSAWQPSFWVHVLENKRLSTNIWRGFEPMTIHAACSTVL